MALILAVNPGNTHSPTLARLARELHGCELIGAESCAVAIRAIDDRIPDLILLPAASPRGEADLLARLSRVPGGIPTVKLPPPASADPSALAGEIRAVLTGAPPPSTPMSSAHVVAAANAAANWIRARKASWAHTTFTVQSPASNVERLASAVARSSEEASEPFGEAIDKRHSTTHDEPSTTHHRLSPTDDRPSTTDEHPSTIDYGPSTTDERPSTSDHRRSLPWAAAGVLLIGGAAALVALWPRIQQSDSGTSAPVTRDTESQPAPPSVAATPEPPVASVPTQQGDQSVAGWVAVFAPFDVTISEADSAVVLDDRNRALLPPGRHRLRFQNTARGYDETRTVTVRPTDTTTVNLNPQSAIEVTSSEPAEVLIDGERVGETPFKGSVTLGTHTVVVRGAGAERQFTVEATSKPVALEADFSKP